MNREIEFRGIHKDTNKFVYGSYVRMLEGDRYTDNIVVTDNSALGDTILGDTIRYVETNSCRIYYTPVTGNSALGDTIRYYIHDENTIGEYTGLKDKNGVKIFEFDYIKHSQGIDVVHFDNGCWSVGSWTPGLLYDFDPCEIEVIGNKYETPILGEK